VLPYKPELKDVLESNTEMADSMSRFNSTLQAAYFLLSVRAHGLAAGPMAGFDAEAVDAEFFADGRWKSILVVNIGHPGVEPWFDRLPRLEHEEVIRWV
jgi:3-hydroxypropanoate dehydrogenase